MQYPVNKIVISYAPITILLFPQRYISLPHAPQSPSKSYIVNRQIVIVKE